MAQVAIVMGSDSDLAIMGKAADTLEKLGITYDMRIISAHREPEEFFEFANTAVDKGYKVIIAGAGMAAHLPGMTAAIFPLPVIGVPLKSASLDGVDALYSILQMPPGIPCATMAIGGAVNAALYAARILAVSDNTILAKLIDYKAELKDKVVMKDQKLSDIGYKQMLEGK